MKAFVILVILGFLISNSRADFIVEAKCLQDERTGIVLTYNDSKPIIVKNCSNPENTQLFYWRLKYAIFTGKSSKLSEKCFVSGSSPVENLVLPTYPCNLLTQKSIRIIDLWNVN